MLTNIIPRQHKTITEYRIEFTNDNGGGFSFNAESNGQVILENDDQKINYKYAMEHPDEFSVQYNEFVKREYSYTEPAYGTCRCGNSVVLEDEYMGACSCENCGQWYNIFGQELINPEYWED